MPEAGSASGQNLKKLVDFIIIGKERELRDLRACMNYLRTLLARLLKKSKRAFEIQSSF